MSASEVKEDFKALNKLHESERESESTTPPLPKVDSSEPCKLTADHNKLKTANSVEETTSNTESTSTELEQPKADTGTSTETAESEKVFSEKGSHARPDVTLEPVPDLPALTVAGFETDELKKTTDQSKERLENSNLKKSGQHGASNPTEEKQKDVNKTPEKAENPKQVEDLDEAIEKNVNRSIDAKGQSVEHETGSDKGIQTGESVDESIIQQTESSTKHGPLKHNQPTQELFVQTPQEEPGNLENPTVREPAPESTVTNRLQQKLSVSRKDSPSQTSIGKEFQISIYHIVLIIMSSTIAATVLALLPALYLLNENSKVNQELDDVQSQLAEINKKLLIPPKDNSDKKNKDWAAEMQETKKRLKAAEMKLNQCMNTTENIAMEIKGAKHNLSEAINNTKIEAWKNITRDKNETAKYISTNFMSYAKWFPIIGTGLVVELLLVFLGAYLYSKWEKKDGHNVQIHEVNSGNREPNRVNPDNDIVRPMNNGAKKHEELQGGMKGVLSRIKAKRLQSKVCVLSFYQETSDKHVELTKSAIQLVDALHGIEVVTTVITKHEEVLDMPPCKVIIMFVDYNQRNVILEDTKKVLGDLKLTTARAILKFNADLVLIYVGHKGSKEIGDRELFSSDITSVQLHPDLREISQKQRFLSVYKQFTKHQKQHLCEILQTDLL